MARNRDKWEMRANYNPLMPEEEPADVLPEPSSLPQVEGPAGISFGALIRVGRELLHHNGRDGQSPAPASAGQQPMTGR
jgi:hypothetical protein